VAVVYASPKEITRFVDSCRFAALIWPANCRLPFQAFSKFAGKLLFAAFSDFAGKIATLICST